MMRWAGWEEEAGEAGRGRGGMVFWKGGSSAHATSLRQDKGPPWLILRESEVGVRSWEGEGRQMRR